MVCRRAWFENKKEETWFENMKKTEKNKKNTRTDRSMWMSAGDLKDRKDVMKEGEVIICVDLCAGKTLVWE